MHNLLVPNKYAIPFKILFHRKLAFELSIQKQLQQPHQDQMVKMEFGQMAQNPMMAQPGNQMPVPVQQIQPDGMQQPMPMPMQQNDFNKMMIQQRMKLNPQAQVTQANSEWFSQPLESRLG